MTYRNDPYDPKQPALLSDEALKDAVHAAVQAYATADSLKALAELKSEHLGDRSAVSLARREIGSLQPAAKAEAGKRVNDARAEIQAAYDARLAELEALEQERVLREER